MALDEDGDPGAFFAFIALVMFAIGAIWILVDELLRGLYGR